MSGVPRDSRLEGLSMWDFASIIILFFCFYFLESLENSILQVWEVRMQRVLQDFKGHNEPVITAAWHPKHEEVFASGAQDGSITHWLASQPDTQVPLIITT